MRALSLYHANFRDLMEQAGWHGRTIREAPREWETNERAFMQADGAADDVDMDGHYYQKK